MADLFKFRCFQCQKLIGAPPSRFGSVVKCPKCGVELIVPSPDSEEAPVEEPDPDAFRPEDLGIRIDPEPLRPFSAPIPPPIEPVGPDPIAFLNRVAASEEANPTAATGERFPEPGEISNEPGDPSELIQAREEPLVSRNRKRGSSSLNQPTIRARDVVLPRTAAVAWAMFGLLALAFAFTSGLFVGHTLWK